MPKKMTTQEFIEKARAVHGDKYDYSKVNYVNTDKKVSIICPIHGEFEQSPHLHLAGGGCNQCAIERNHTLSKRNNNKFIKESRKVHGNKYDYSKVNYDGCESKVSIICPIHGKFEQRAEDHLRGHGCSKCSGRNKFTTQEFIKKAHEIHNNKYDYSKVNYVNSITPVTIICPIHGEFLKKPSMHLCGQGCPKCSFEERKKKRTKPLEQFVEEARKVHGNKYDYSKVNYVNANIEVSIICPIHGEFLKKPSKHLYGQGCPICNYGFTKSYILSLLTEYDLDSMTAHQLIELIKMGVLPQQLRELTFSKAGSKKRKDTIQKLKEELSGDATDEEVEKRLEEDAEKAEQEYEQEESSSDDNANQVFEDEKPETVIKSLKIYDNCKFNISSGEGEKFILEEELHRLWNKTLDDEVNFVKMFKNEPSSGAFFDKIRDVFFQQYAEVSALAVDKDCVFIHSPNLMQKLMVYYVQKNPYFGNWSAPGAGKSFSRDWFARAIDARVSVYVVPNGVIDTTVNSINEAYNGVNIVIPQDLNDITVLDRSKYNVFLLNYEKFQQPYTGAWIAELLKNKIDFICLDEIQNVKVRNTDNISLRNKNMNTFIKNARVQNPDLKLLAMSATPIINNLTEVRELMGLMTGTEYDEIGDRISMDNVHNAYKALLINGFRYIPKYDISINETPVEIDGSDVQEELKQCKEGEIVETESILVKKKIEYCIANGLIRKPTIIYTQYTDKGRIVQSMRTMLEQAGFKVGCYTGNEDSELRKNTIESFINGKINVLIGSKPIVEGVNGLQYICNNIIPVSLPWTASDWQQLLGRIYRQGSNFKEVNVIIPEVVIGEWSWDKRRKAIIDNKRTLGEAVLDGSFEHVRDYNSEAMQKKLLSQALSALRNGINDNDVSRREIEVDVIDTEIKKRERIESEINEIHRIANTVRPENIQSKCYGSSDNFKEYHRKRREAIQNNWVSDPLDKVAEVIKSYKTKVYENVIDLGCGENLLKMKITDGKKVVGVDVEKIDDTVIQANCANLKDAGIEDESFQIAVHCLSLWGNSYMEYINEDYRILESGMNAVLIIVEPSEKFGENEHYGTIDEFISNVESVGFKKKGNPEDIDGKFKMFQFTK